MKNLLFLTLNLR